MPRKILESSVKRGLNNYLKKVPGHFFHYPAYAGVPGVSDKLGVVKGRFVAIEVKSPDRKGHKFGGLSDAQRAFRETVEENGGLFIVCYHWEDVRVEFENEGLL